MTEKNNIILIGFMGTGKTAVGKKLAKQLKFNFVDLDSKIEKQSRKKISLIFDKHGEKYFRQLETTALKSLLKNENMVISTGGGIILKPQNIKLLHKSGKVFLLNADPEVIYDRIKDDKSRPLVNFKSKEKLRRIKSILKFRRTLYKNAADYVINTSQLTVGEVVEKIKKIWERFRSC
jgi:shikimate kinase